MATVTTLTMPRRRRGPIIIQPQLLYVYLYTAARTAACAVCNTEEALQFQCCEQHSTFPRLSLSIKKIAHGAIFRSDGGAPTGREHPYIHAVFFRIYIHNYTCTATKKTPASQYSAPLSISNDCIISDVGGGTNRVCYLSLFRREEVHVQKIYYVFLSFDICTSLYLV